MTNINIAIPDEVHKKLKVVSAQKGVTLKSLVVELLEEFVNKKEKRGGRP